MELLSEDSLKDLHRGDRVVLAGTGVRETFQATSTIGRCQYFISLQFGFEYTRPQLIAKYSRANCTFAVQHMPEGGWGPA